MKAFIVDKYGKDVPLRAGELPAPVTGEHDVLIAVHAAGVNPIDNKIKSGEFKLILPFKVPFVLGRDLAGVVMAVGSAVHRFAPGDEVYASLGKAATGAFAELVAVNEDEVARKPNGLSMAEAAALPMVTLTAWQALVEKARVRPGDRLLIHAGSGGVGSIAIQLAKHLGAHVATTTSTGNLDWVRALGADEVVDYRAQDFATVLHDYDYVLDPLGGETLEKSVRVVRPGGLIIGINGPPDPAFAGQLGKPLLRPVMALLSRKIRRLARRNRATYSFLFMRADGPQLGEITRLVEAGVLRPVVDRVFDSADTEAALKYVDTGRAKGKVVVSRADADNAQPGSS
jgi:NADPH:quinone reductase-like Zn-dependent oxidoreductase